MNAITSSWPAFSEAEPLNIAGELSTDGAFPTTKRGRRSERVSIEFAAGLRQRGASGVSIQIMDLSVDGFRAATHLELYPGTDVWLRLPGLESCHARVVWAGAHYVGCAFVRPLHPAVLQMIVDKATRR